MPLCTDYTQGRGAVQALPGRGAFTLNVIIAIIGVKSTIWLLSHPPYPPFLPSVLFSFFFLSPFGFMFSYASILSPYGFIRYTLCFCF